MWPGEEKSSGGKGLLVVCLGVVAFFWLVVQVEAYLTAPGDTLAQRHAAVQQARKEARLEREEVRQQRAREKRTQRQVDQISRDGRRAVRAILRDPDSARFSQLRYFISPTGAAVLCGYVNAKNAFGGYTGDTRFISLGRPEDTWLENQAADFDATWARYCYGR